MRSLPAREEAGAEKGAEARGGEELEALGQRMQAAREDDEDAPKRSSVRKLVLDADPATELERPGLLGAKRVGAASTRKPSRRSVWMVPPAGRGFEEVSSRSSTRRAQARGRDGPGQPRDAPADDRQLHAGATFMPVLRDEVGRAWR